MQRYWFGDITDGGECIPFSRETNELIERCRSLEPEMDNFVPVEPETAVECGVFSSRQDYIAELRKITAALAREKISEYYSSGDIELIQMVRMLNELDHVINLLVERGMEWYIVKNPDFSRKYKNMNQKKVIGMMRRQKRSGLSSIAAEIDALSDKRTRLMKEISGKAVEVAPNCSEIVGGLVAARLISSVGGLKELAFLPASAIQVTGAESALFTHLKGGTPSPKHGIIFQHRRVHNADRAVRGKVARVVAGKLGIAARIDYFRGEADVEFLKKAQERIDAVFGGVGGDSE
ncbi:Pre-mRNA processing ribonucleoprotein, binding domain protein [Methanolacinia petrolearia DSM 11571]|uniref:Pre-mRNA processing ribonucleoprotein, binding domain protein n=1 Tax=Methanolacinia petrolearia (strain DSM 11571 / OCM 486 / SEBR 4847) TaxID=679926 RepID=E1RGF6_METP4|nr:Pre-mRNA processing ribonucleoprotein,-binding domain-containing protein [Methanolacinia petrolearia]ADN35167.1 Pre-mRNA processing ribonucleoprotein, binding domain protein [Methanolacinia petrolearia DSM 11571]